MDVTGLRSSMNYLTPRWSVHKSKLFLQITIFGQHKAHFLLLFCILKYMNTTVSYNLTYQCTKINCKAKQNGSDSLSLSADLYLLTKFLVIYKFNLLKFEHRGRKLISEGLVDITEYFFDLS